MKYKEKSEQLEAELNARLEEIQFLKSQIAAYEENLVASIGPQLDSKEAREVLCLFASKASNRNELALLVRALSKIPA